MPAQTLIAAIASVVCVAFVGLAYRRRNWTWTGFFYRRDDGAWDRRTLWDWLGLLIVPVAVVAVGVALTVAASDREASRQRAQDRRNERTAADNRREEALRGYLQQMSSLVLQHKLRRAEPDSDVAVLARTLTLSVLRRLDAARKGTVVRFLFETQLIIPGSHGFPLVDLHGADLTGVRLGPAELPTAQQGAPPDFSGADLRRAEFHDDDLWGEPDFPFADLKGPVFRAVQFFQPNFSYTDLRGVHGSHVRICRTPILSLLV
jgi:uncharacterized protein YjbI with pentapeptide repeats